jgi:toxin FitB
VTFLLDTNVVSELRRGPSANANVRAWDASSSEAVHFISVVVVVAELRKGALARKRKDPRVGAALDHWIDRVIAGFADRILPVDIRVADVWA